MRALTTNILNKMARSDKKSNASKQAIPLTIAEETAIFLKAGGKIQQIPTGVSGQVNLAGPKHIKLGNKSNEASEAAKSVNPN